MPPRTILRAPYSVGSSSLKPYLGGPRLLARPARHAESEQLTSAMALPLRPRRLADDGTHHPLREAVCGPSLVLLALSSLSQTPKSIEEAAKLPLAVVAATPACVHVRLCFDNQIFTAGALDLAIEIENCASHPIALSFGSGQSFDFCATRQGETVPFWRWASGRRFPSQLRALRLDSGCALRFEAQWPDAPAGQWTIEGKVTANGGFAAETVEIEIS
ncbi:hypothetical protein IAD21_01415 [Abditibacteriota bacterium]|nr:hypothetical protein IAD21_01415 [Abditibacteriota bacterium]